MPIKGKKQYLVWLTEERVDYVRALLGSSAKRGGLSGLFDDYLLSVIQTLESEMNPGAACEHYWNEARRLMQEKMNL